MVDKASYVNRSPSLNVSLNATSTNTCKLYIVCNERLHVPGGPREINQLDSNAMLFVKIPLLSDPVGKEDSTRRGVGNLHLWNQSLRRRGGGKRKYKKERQRNQA